MRKPFAFLIIAASCVARPLMAHASCDAPRNAIEAENCLPGNPDSEWNITGMGDPSIQGFATDISVEKGDTIRFKVKTDASNYRFDIYRMGFYQENGARKVASVLPTASLPQNQPACMSDASTGLVDCGNWDESGSWQVPDNAVSGIYFAKLTRTDTGGASHIVFVVRDDASRAELLFQTSDPTWQAYNSYGGNSFYLGNTPAQRAYKISYNRPFITRQDNSSFVFMHEYPMVRWLESNGYDVTYFTGLDSDRRGDQIKNHKVFLSVGHDEYWSKGQRTNVEAARNAGVSLMFLSGNDVYWKTRWENSISDDHTPNRTLVCYKETYDGPIDPSSEWTGTWRDGEFSPPADGGKPENALTGTLFTVNAFRNDALVVGASEGKHRFWRNTSLATMPNGTIATFPQIIGYEWDEDVDNGFRPPGLMRLSSSTYAVDKRLIDVGRTFVPAVATHYLMLYRHSSGAYVFGAGTMQWSWGLDSFRNNGTGLPPDVRLQQATVNMLADMGAQPVNLRPNLIPATPSTDATPPTSTVLGPTDGSHIVLGSLVVVSGTAADTGGIPAGVEVSVDNGVTWHATQGRPELWRYRWRVSQMGTAIIRTRAVDDTGNLETPSSGTTVTVGNTEAPTLASISPVNANAGGAAFTLTANGSNFFATSKIRWGDNDLPTTFVSATQLEAQVSTDNIALRGVVPVRVFNDDGGLSGLQNFEVRLVPTLSALEPASVVVGSSSFTILLIGSNFASDSEIHWNNSTRETIFVSTGELRAVVLKSDLVKIGTATVSVLNPSPGGTSGEVIFRITEQPEGPPTPPSPSAPGPNPDSMLLVNRVFPNPWRANEHGGSSITFNFVTPTFKVDIFTIAGQWLKTLSGTNAAVSWDLKNDSGDNVASGYYLYRIQGDGAETATGSLAVVR